MKKNVKGLTMIELLIVITIIGILSAVVANKMGAFAGAKARDSVRLSDLNTIATNIGSLTNRFHTPPLSGDKGKYPDPCKGKDGSKLFECLNTMKLMTEEELSEVLTDPKQGTDVPGGTEKFGYYYGATPNGFKLCAYMEDQAAFENMNAYGSSGNGKKDGASTEGQGMHCIAKGSKGWSADIISKLIAVQ